MAFSFVRRLLGLNGPAPDDQPVEVILLSRNDPDTGLRARRIAAVILRGAAVDRSQPVR